MAQCALLPFLHRAVLSVDSMLAAQQGTGWASVAQSLDPSCKTIVVLPVSLQDESGSDHSPHVLVSESTGLVFGKNVFAEGRAHKAAHHMANELVSDLLSLDADTYLAAQYSSSSLMVFTFAATSVMSRIRVPGAVWVKQSDLTGHLAEWAVQASGAVLSVSPPPGADHLTFIEASQCEAAKQWRAAQHAVSDSASLAGALDAQSVKAALAPLGKTTQELALKTASIAAADKLLQKAIEIEADKGLASTRGSMLAWADYVKPAP
jgi:hypothetical protein